MIDFLSINVTNIILIILLTIVLITFGLYLYNENRKLKIQIEELRKENKSLLEKKIMKQESVDSVSIQKISTEKNTIENNEKLDIKINEDKIDNTTKKTNLKINTPSSASTLTESEQNHKYTYYNLDDKKVGDSFNLSDLINKNDLSKLKEDKIVPNYNYLEEIQARMTEELKPQTIELTDYEKKQEEQAVISYKELLRFKDNNNYIDEKQETIKFIEELKNLRNSLK